METAGWNDLGARQGATRDRVYNWIEFSTIKLIEAGLNNR